MKSNVIRVTRDKDNLNGILEEARRSAAYAELDAKKTLRLRLLAEELMGLLRELAEDFEGKFWIENKGMHFTMYTTLRTWDDMNRRIKSDLISVSTQQKNAAATGIVGKIRDIVENMLYPKDSYYNASFVAYQLETAVLLEDSWSLDRYKKSQKDKAEPWDELEKSIIANLADDVTVSVKGKQVEIVITKDFEEEAAK